MIGVSGGHERGFRLLPNVCEGARMLARLSGEKLPC
jgi:hypothetical protein